jgi:glycosyltransferase involved in cell wall biosynthesis
MNKNNLPKISVVIPVLNAQQSIEKAIRSVLDQNYENLELILLDAGSTDGTLDIIKKYEASIDYWHSKPDGSAYHAINLGIQQSTGELIAQLMADDWFEPMTFQAIAKAFGENPDADMISCGGRIVRYDEDAKQYKVVSSYTTRQQIELSFYNVCFGVPAMSTRFFTRTLIEKVGLIAPFDSEGKHIFSGDREFLLRAITNHCKNIVVSQLGHTYLAHEGSATFGKNRKTILRIFQEHMATAKSYLAKPGLTRQQQAVLKRWYNDQSVRFLLFKMLEQDFKTAWSTAINGMKATKLSWLIALFYTPCKIAARKLYLRSMEKRDLYV